MGVGDAGCGGRNGNHRRERGDKKVPSEKTDCPGLHIPSLEKRGGEKREGWEG